MALRLVSTFIVIGILTTLILLTTETTIAGL